MVIPFSVLRNTRYRRLDVHSVNTALLCKDSASVKPPAKKVNTPDAQTAFFFIYMFHAVMEHQKSMFSKPGTPGIPK